MKAMKNLNVKGLERHLYAPELNILHLIDGAEIRVPGCTTIEDALLYISKQKR